MSGSVSIDIDALQGAISALTGLAGRIDSQRNNVLNGTPCELPSLSAGTIGAVSAWLTDQEPELSTRLDLAKLLASEGANVVSYTTDADTLANVQQMLGHEMAERVNDVSYDTDDDWLRVKCKEGESKFFFRKSDGSGRLEGRVTRNAIGREGLGVPINIEYGDLMVRQAEYESSCSTVLLLDTSHTAAPATEPQPRLEELRQSLIGEYPQVGPIWA